MVEYAVEQLNATLFKTKTMFTRNPQDISTYLSVNKIAAIVFIGVIGMRSPNADALSNTLVCMFCLYMMCWAQQFKDKKNIIQVFNYLAKRLPVEENSSDRLLLLSEKMVTFAVNSPDSGTVIHAAVQEVVGAVNAEKNKRSSNYSEQRFNNIELAEKTFESWTKKVMLEKQNTSTPSKGN